MELAVTVVESKVSVAPMALAAPPPNISSVPSNPSPSPWPSVPVEPVPSFWPLFLPLVTVLLRTLPKISEDSMVAVPELPSPPP